MFCILITTYIGLQVANQRQTYDCFASLDACNRAVPAFAHQQPPPAPDHRQVFRCVREERPA